MHHHHAESDDQIDATAPQGLPVPPGFIAAFSNALEECMPSGIVSAIGIWEGKERVGINFKDVADQERVINAVSEALDTISNRFEYFPGIDISIWKH
jgi:hypothetical protein